MGICNDKLEERIITLIQDRMRCTFEPVDGCTNVLFATKKIAFAIVHTEYFVKSRLYIFWEKNGKLRRKKIIETPHGICHPDLQGRKARVKNGFVNVIVDFTFGGHCLHEREPKDVIVLCHGHSALLSLPLGLFK